MSQSKAVITPSDLRLQVLQAKLGLLAAWQHRCSWRLSRSAQPWAAQQECSPQGCTKCLEVEVKPTWGAISTSDSSSALFSKQHQLEEVSLVSLGKHVLRHGDFFLGKYREHSF